MHEQVTVASLGMNFISEMSRKDLIDEIQLAQRGMLEKESDDALRRFVVTLRMNSARERLYREAGFHEQGSWFGGLFD